MHLHRALLPNITARTSRAILLLSAVVSLAPFAKATGQQGDSGGRASRAHSAIVEDKIVVKIRAGDDVKSLLQAQGIVPDGQAIGRFYKLNPQVSNANALKVGSNVFLPVIRRSDTAFSDESPGRWVIRGDTTYKKMLEDRATRLVGLSRQLAANAGATAREKQLSGLSARIASQARMVARSSTLDPSAVTLLEGDLSLFEEQLSTAPGHASSVDSAIETAKVVTADLAPHVTASRAGLNHLASVRFTVIDANNIDRANVTVICAVPLLPDDSGKQRKFDKLEPETNPVEADLSLGRWLIWVENLDGIEVSRRRQEIDVSSNTISRPIVLVVR